MHTMRAGGRRVGDNPVSSHAETRMQRQTLLVFAAVFALLACAAWFLSVREAPRARAASPVAQLSSPAPAPSSRAVPATPVPTPAPASPAAMPPPAIAATPTEDDGVKDDAGEAPIDSAPEDKVAEAPPDDAAGAQAAQAPPEGTGNSDTSPSAGTPAAAADTASPTSEGAVHDAPSPAATPDPHDVRAADLFAQRIGALDDGHGDNAQDAAAAAAQQAYEARDEGGDVAKATQAIVHDLFANWLATLPLESSHASLISIDCRDGACRVLVAQTGVDFTGAAQLERESPVNAFRRLLADFSRAAAWSDAGLSLQDNQMSAAGATADKPNDIALWTIYLRVADTVE